MGKIKKNLGVARMRTLAQTMQGLELTNKLTYCLPPAADRHAFTCTAMQHVQCAVAAKWSIVEMFQLGVNVHMLFVI
jgi:hypothetical protein